MRFLTNLVLSAALLPAIGGCAARDTTAVPKVTALAPGRTRALNPDMLEPEWQGRNGYFGMMFTFMTR